MLISTCCNIIIQAKALDCNHIFCTYCLDLFQQCSKTCPECSCRVKSSIPLPQVDNQIDILLKSLPPQLQYSIQSARVQRNEKSHNRSENLKELVKKLPSSSGLSEKVLTGQRKPFVKPQGIFNSQTIEQVCNALISSASGSDSQNQGKQFLPKLGFTSNLQRSRPSTSTAVTPRQAQKPRSKITLRNSQFENFEDPILRDQSRIPKTGRGVTMTIVQLETPSVDVQKAEGLFQLYDQFLQGGEGGGGDGSGNHENHPQNQSPVTDTDFENGLKELKEKQKVEIETLLQEADGVVELDQFVSKWSSDINSKLSSEDDNQEDEEGKELSSSYYCGEILMGRNLSTRINALKKRLKNVGIPKKSRFEEGFPDEADENWPAIMGDK